MASSLRIPRALRRLIIPPTAEAEQENPCQPLDSDNKLCGAGGLADSLNTTRSVSQAFHVIRIVPSLPPVEGLRRDTKIATGEAGVLMMRLVVIEPFKSVPGFL